MRKVDGYAPGTLMLNPKIGVMNPIMVRRLRCAALDDEARSQWDSFD
jgi:hypothetical protein